MRSKTERFVAIWIDHREAILEIFTRDHLNQEEEIYSDAGSHTHGGGWAQHRLEAHRHQVLKHFYEEIVDHLGEVDKILLLGPGQAKHELHHQIEHHKGLRGVVVLIESAPPLSVAELVSRAQVYFDITSMRE